MNPKNAKTTSRIQPSDDLVRDYAYHLYIQGGRVPGHDVDNWLEAKACLCTNLPKHRSHARLHTFLNDAKN